MGDDRRQMAVCSQCRRTRKEVSRAKPGPRSARVRRLGGTAVVPQRFLAVAAPQEPRELPLTNLRKIPRATTAAGFKFPPPRTQRTGATYRYLLTSVWSIHRRAIEFRAEVRKTLCKSKLRRQP